MIHIIWKSVEHDQIRGYEEVVGAVVGGREEADLVVARLNAGLPEGHRERGWRVYGYRAEEVDRITAANVGEYIPGEGGA